MCFFAIHVSFIGEVTVKISYFFFFFMELYKIARLPQQNIPKLVGLNNWNLLYQCSGS